MPIARTVGAAALAILATAAPAAADPEPPRPGLSLAFHDEFDGDALGPAWTTHYKTGERRLTGEAEVYVDPDDPAGTVRVEGGRLLLTARAATGPIPGYPDAGYVSGMVSSHAGPLVRFGYVEARIKLPRGKGLWPAFWLFRQDGIAPYGEIDVMENLGDEPGTVYSTLHHGPTHPSRRMNQVEAKAAELGFDAFAGEFHVYAVDWGPERTRFLIDGRETASYPTGEEIKAPMHILLNLAVGGEWAGTPDPAVFPATMEVDWVRAWAGAASAPAVSDAGSGAATGRP